MSSKPGRNDPCHCGSMRKYKKCCLRKDRVAHRKKQRRRVARVRSELEFVWSLRRPLPVEEAVPAG